MINLSDKTHHLRFVLSILLTLSGMFASSNLSLSAPLKAGKNHGDKNIATLLSPGDTKKQMRPIQHGIIVALSDLPEPMSWSEAKSTCDSLTTSGYTDWMLPDIHNLKQLYYGREAIGGFLNSEYWSATEQDHTTAWTQQFGDGKQEILSKEKRFRVRPVRFF